MGRTRDLLLGISENGLDTDLGAKDVAVKEAEMVSALSMLIV